MGYNTAMRMLRYGMWCVMGMALAACCETCPFSFEEYDYDRHRDAHIDLRNVDADVKVDRHGLRVGKSFKLNKPPAKKTHKESPLKEPPKVEEKE